MIRFERSAQSARECITSLMNREGLTPTSEPFPSLVDQHDAIGVIAVCSEMRRPVKVLLFAVKNSDGFYVFRFKCPNESFMEHLCQMQQIISTILIQNNRENCI